VTIVATRPLTRDESWSSLPRAALSIFENGDLVGGKGAALAAA
jgi:hypothetical protein